MQTYLQLNDIKQNLDEKHYQEFLDFTQYQDQRFIQNDTIKVLEDKIIQFKNNEYVKVKDNDLLNFLNEYVLFKIQNPNYTKYPSFDTKETQFLENLGIYPHKMIHHYEILDKLQQFQLLGIKIDYPSQFLSKKLKFPTIDVSLLKIKPINSEFLVAYINNLNKIEYASKLNPFSITHLNRYENSVNLQSYLTYLENKAKNSKNIDDESKNKAFAMIEDLRSTYLIPVHLNAKLTYSTNDIYIKSTDLFENYFHQRFQQNQRKRIYNTISYEDEKQLYYLNDFISELHDNLSHYVEKNHLYPQQKYRDIVIKTIKEFKDKTELVKDQHLHQFLKHQLDLDISTLDPQKNKKTQNIKSDYE